MVSYLNCSSFRSTNCPDQENSFLFDSNPSDGINQMEESINQTNLDKDIKNGVNNDISVDSLDMSLFEKNTSKLLQKCSQRDKSNYMIAFEGSITGSQDLLSGLEQQRRHWLLNRNHISSNCELRHNQLADPQMTKSELYSRSAVRRQNERNLNEQSSESMSKFTQSIPDIRALLRMNSHYRLPYCPVSGFIPLYDLQSSQSSNSHSSGSEFSPPRSLVKVFMQNRSPLSSQPMSPSLSYDSPTPMAAESPIRPLYYNILDLTRSEANNNNILTESKTNSDHQFSNENSDKTRIRSDSHRIPYDLKQTFPIREVDESMSESSISETLTTPTDLNRNRLNQDNISRTNSICDYLDSIGINQNMNDGRTREQLRVDRSRSNVRTTSTQFPVRLVDKQVQASVATVGEQTAANSTPLVTPLVTPLTTPESPNACNKPVYVFYPNYSLPDLSFLEQVLEKHSNCGPKTVYLSPTKHQMPDKESVSVQMRRTVKSKSRPKSFTDFETLSKQNFSHIKDWDSLNILLPNEFKELIQKANNVSNNDNNEQMSNEVLSSDSSNPKVRMRSHRSSAHLSDNNSFYSRRGYARNKRFSLQEYPFYQINETEVETDCHNISQTENSCLTRSQTMPNCHNSCHCHQHCCHGCCHSCCRTPRQSPSANSANKSLVQTSNCEINTNSIDKLCQLLAMDLSFKKLMNIIDEQNCRQNLTNRSNMEAVRAAKDGQHSECKQNTSDEQLSLNPNKETMHFKELQKRWELLAALSPTDPKTVTSAGLCQKSGQLSEKVEPNRAVKKPEVARKPQVVLRRPQSSIPRPTSLNTDPTAHSHRKSLIPVPKPGLRSPVSHSSKTKSNGGHKTCN